MATSLLDLDFKIEGVSELKQTLGIFVSHMADLRPVWPDVVTNIVEDVRGNFNSQGGGSWPELSPVYQAWKNAAYPGRPLLVRNGKLLKSLVDRGDPWFRFEPGRTGMTYGSRHPAARWHQTGTRRMPARPPIRMTRATQLATAKLMQEFIFKSGQGASSRFGGLV